MVNTGTRTVFACGINILSGKDEYVVIKVFEKELVQSEPFLPFPIDGCGRGWFIWQIQMGKVHSRFSEKQGITASVSHNLSEHNLTFSGWAAVSKKKGLLSKKNEATE